jgi:integrase
MKSSLSKETRPGSRFRLVRREGPNFYAYDQATKKRKSLGTADRTEAQRLLFAQNAAHELGGPNLTIGRAYLQNLSLEMTDRTWAEVMAHKEAEYLRQGITPSLIRWRKVCRSAPFRLLQKRLLGETLPEHFLAVLHHQQAGPSTNAWLRLLHNYALDQGWLYAPVLLRKIWPAIRHKAYRGPTESEHRRIVAAAADREEQLYYEFLWETGGMPTAIALLSVDQIRVAQKTLLYPWRSMQGAKKYAEFQLGDRLLGLLGPLPKKGFLFPRMAKMSVENRARRFRFLCRSLGIQGISLHCYRYSWAERARKADAPLRMVMEVLGHQSRAVRQA